MENSKQIIEINGVKLEVDLRSAKVVDHFSVGETVKVLVKDYQTFTPYVGVIVGFDEFKERPTIIVAYLKTGYSSCSIEYVYINKDSTDVELCRINDWDIPFKKSELMEMMDSEIEKQKEKLRELESKKQIFMTRFGSIFEHRV